MCQISLNIFLINLDFFDLLYMQQFLPLGFLSGKGTDVPFKFVLSSCCPLHHLCDTEDFWRKLKGISVVMNRV